MKFLVTDLNIALDGHKYGFVNNLLAYVGKHKTLDSFVFLVNYSTAFELKSEWSHVKVISLSQAEQFEINSQKGFIAKSAAEWKYIDKYTRKNACDRLILMELDPYQIEIGKKETPYRISGIWFRPYARMEPESGSLKHRILFWRTKLQKRLVMTWAKRNKQLDKIFILNDEEMPSWLNGNKERFFTLPDPYFDYPSLESFDIREKYGIPGNNLILLQFGYMDERKNNENIIAALDKLGLQDLTLLVVGKHREGYEQKLLSLRPSTAPYQMVVKNDFVSDAEMESVFQQSDLILRMNVNFFGSSGIVGIAARHNKPVIVSDSGVMAGLVRKYRLGDVVNPYDITAISQVVSNYRNNRELLAIDGKEYRNSHNIEAFSETLLQQ